MYSDNNSSDIKQQRRQHRRQHRRYCCCCFDRNAVQVFIILLFSIYFLNIYNSVNIFSTISTTRNEKKNNNNYDFTSMMVLVDAFTTSVTRTSFSSTTGTSSSFRSDSNSIDTCSKTYIYQQRRLISYIDCGSSNTYTRQHKQQQQQQLYAFTTGTTNRNWIPITANDMYLTLTTATTLTTGSATRTTKLYSTTTATGSEVNDVDDTDNQKKQQQQQDSMVTNYKQFSYLSFLLSIIYILVLLVPVVSSSTGTSTSTILAAVQVPASIGYSIVGFLSRNVLIGATQYNRLSSDTYKRLNIGILLFCFCSLVNNIMSILSLKSISLSRIMVVLPIAFYNIYGIIVSFIGWKYGVLCNKESITNESTSSSNNNNNITTTIKTLLIELWSGCIESIKSIIYVQYPKKSVTYRNCLLLMLSCIFSNCMQILYTIRNIGTVGGATGATSTSLIPNTISLVKTSTTSTLMSTLSTATIGTNIASISRLVLLSTIILSLKDASERNRLNGTTFIQYNCLLSIWAIINGIIHLLVSLTVSTSNTMSIQNYSVYRCIQMIVFSYPFTIRAIRSIIEKKNEKSKE